MSGDICRQRCGLTTRSPPLTTDSPTERWPESAAHFAFRSCYTHGQRSNLGSASMHVLTYVRRGPSLLPAALNRALERCAKRGGHVPAGKS